LLSGKRAFPGESISDTLAGVLKVEPDWDALPARTPAPVRRLIQCCLNKEPRQRLQAIGDTRLLLSEVQEAPAQPTRTSKGWAVWGVAAALAIVAAWGWLRPQSQAPAAPSFALTILAPKGTDLEPIGSQSGAPLLSPDGTYVLTSDLLRNLNSLRMEPLRSMAEVSGEPFWSADSKWVAFPRATQLRKMRVPDGAPEVVA
jgi:eukaryotic-like serine/threonine-protein kinase